MPRWPIGRPECGSAAAYHYHVRHQEDIDEACRAAMKVYRRTDPNRRAHHDAQQVAARLLRGRHSDEYDQLYAEALRDARRVRSQQK